MSTPKLIGSVLGILLAFSATAVLLGRSSGSKSSELGTLRGQVGVPKNDGTVVVPESATAYIMYESAMIDHSFQHRADPDTAGGQFHSRHNKNLASNKELKELMKSSRKAPRPETADLIAANYLRSVDEAISAVIEWVGKHPDKSWQFTRIEVGQGGVWSADGFRAGEYEIIIRGKVLGHDADWEAGVDLNPGQTISVPSTSPKFFRTVR